MNKKEWPMLLFPVSVFAMIALILILLFVPDMSTTLINTVPEYPPELGTIDSNETLVSDAVTVDKTNIKNLVAAMRRPSEYFSETQSILSHSKGSATYLRKTWVKGKLTRIDSLLSSGAVSERRIYSDKFVYIWAPSSRTYHKAARGDFRPDDDRMMMHYEDIINANDEDIATAQLTMYDGASCIYAEIRRPQSGYTERYWVSVSTGLLVYGQTLDKNGSVIYSITATQTDISTQSTDLFILPDGEYVTE